MDWQLVITWTAIACATSFIFWRGVRVVRSKQDCGGGCGCAKTAQSDSNASLIAPEQLVLRKSR